MSVSCSDVPPGGVVNVLLLSSTLRSSTLTTPPGRTSEHGTQLFGSMLGSGASSFHDESVLAHWCRVDHLRPLQQAIFD